jgi:hypothetical protein
MIVDIIEALADVIGHLIGALCSSNGNSAFKRRRNEYRKQNPYDHR